MAIFKNACVPGLLIAALFCGTGGSARETDDEESATEADWMIRDRRSHMDTSWLETTLWTEYGYRPYVKAHYHRFTDLPSYAAGNRYGYSYGIVQDPTIVDLSVLDKQGKNKIQMNKYGLWH
jgi:hypothetical protein